MNRLLPAIGLSLAFVVAPAPARAQVQAQATFSLQLPVIMPPLVVIQPGVQVIQDVDEEVFFSGGFYWTRRPAGWYRSGNPRSGWIFMPRGAPPAVAAIPPGKYKRWKGPPPGHGGPERGRAVGHERDHHDHDRDHRDRDRGHDRDDDRGRGRGKRD
jgi:hypothetical protein